LFWGGIVYAIERRLLFYLLATSDGLSVARVHRGALSLGSFEKGIAL